MNKKRQILLSAVLASALAANAQVTINVDASNPGIKVSPNLYGIFLEDINHAADGGLYAELISNRSFEDDDKNIPTWKTAAQEGAKINAQLINKGLTNRPCEEECCAYQKNRNPHCVVAFSVGVIALVLPERCSME